MDRTIICIEPAFEERVQIRLDKLPSDMDIAGARNPVEFHCDPDRMPSWANQMAVQEHGNIIRNALIEHPAIQAVFSSVLNTAPGQTRPIFFDLRFPDSERIYWETLCDGNGNFLALDYRWPIGRIAESVTYRRASSYNYEPPLKIMALLSPAGINASNEWNSLRDAVLRARERHFPVEVSVLTGQQALINGIREEIDKGLAGVNVEPMPDRSSIVEDLIQNYRPQILHFFCHGLVAHNSGLLQLALITDQPQESEVGSLELKVDDLSKNTAVAEGVWLVILNCCEGSKSLEHLNSMAYQLVVNGLPAAVGMIEPIDASDANEFTSGFYTSVFNDISVALGRANPKGITELEWVESLRFPRNNLRENHGDPASNRQWALPVLYVRRAAFELETAAAIDPNRRRELEIYEEFLRYLRSVAPEQVSANMATQLLEDIPEELSPDLR